MKHFYPIIVALLAFSANAQTINIPDANFKAKLLSSNLTDEMNVARDLSHQALIIDANNDGEIQVEEALNVSFLNIMDSGIISLDGIENFTNLQSLYCSENQIANLDYMLPSLKTLECYGNAITHLAVTNFPQLSTINCNNNLITALDFRSNAISAADCSDNLISEIHFGALQYGSIVLRNNLITNLEISDPGNEIEMIDISDNPIVNLSIEAYSVDYFVCVNTALINLDLSKIERESPLGNEFYIVNNPFLRTINFHNGAMDFCIPDPFYDCTNSSFSLDDNPELESVCADEGNEMSFLQPFATAQGFTLTSDCALAVNSNIGLQESVIYPNPADKIVNIHANTAIVQVNVLNTLGQMVSQIKNASQSYDLTIDIADLKSGTYFVEMLSNSGKSTKKLLKL